MDLGVGVFSCTVNDHLEIIYQKAIDTKLRSEAFYAIQVFGTETSTTTNTDTNKTKKTTKKNPHQKPCSLSDQGRKRQARQLQKDATSATV